VWFKWCFRQNSLMTALKNVLLRKHTVLTSFESLPVSEDIKLDDHLLSIVDPVAARLFQNGFNLRQLLTFVREHG
jgi:hypothetical protein